MIVDKEQLPEDWDIKSLGDLYENLDNRRIPITKSSRNSGDIPYYGASGIVDYVADFIFNEDLLLVSEDGANLLARTYPIAFSITGKTWVNNHAHVLRFKEKITQTFIEYYLNSIPLDLYVSGMAQPKLNQKALNSIPIPVPSPDEQKQIVAILNEAFEGIDQAIRNTEKNLANLNELKQSILQKAFTGQLTQRKFIKAEEFDAGEDLTEFMDFSTARHPNREKQKMELKLPLWMIRQLETEAKKQGISPQTFLENYLVANLTPIN